MTGNIDIVELMLNVSSPPADVNLPTMQPRRTPLHEACAVGRADIVKLLLARSNDKGCVYRLDKKQKTPYELASPEVKILLNLYHHGSSSSLQVGASKSAKITPKKYDYNCYMRLLIFYGLGLNMDLVV